MQRLLVKLTWGVEAPERMSQALSVVAAAEALGAEVSLWLTGEATRLGCLQAIPDFSLPHAPNLDDMRQQLAPIMVICTQCAARRGITENELAPGVRFGGAAEFAAECLADNTQVLVY